MALGTTLIVEGGAAIGPVWLDRLTIVGDSTYPTGGTSGLLDKYRKLKGSPGANIIAVIPQDAGGYHVTYDHVNDKLKVYANGSSGAADSEVANATNLSAVTINLLAVVV